MVDIPPEYRDLFEVQSFATFVTLHPSGMPHPTPVWIGYDSGQEPTAAWERDGEKAILVNTAAGRQKHENVTRDPRVAGTILDPDDPYRYLSFQGEVAEITTEGAIEHIDALAQRYMDVETYPHHGEEGGERVILRIEPTNVLLG